jgi:hypothetical protein
VISICFHQIVYVYVASFIHKLMNIKLFLIKINK